ncbi:hypothetical protein J2Z64_000452 [Oceanobacillus polygoni]|uniref:Uncharacterized protein n=1 Tax=Oceanobacillus polygoni TaxID=1235259 RepID=A0A9X1CAU7_9BACI|nr:hypothetical protein [Oceanobacillus polygoni]
MKIGQAVPSGSAYQSIENNGEGAIDEVFYRYSEH